MADDQWTIGEHLLALVHDQLATANWQRTKDGSKGRNRPKPLSPLAQAQMEAAAADDPRNRHYGRPTIPQDEVLALLRRLGHDI